MDRRDMNLLKTVGLIALLNYMQNNNGNGYRRRRRYFHVLGSPHTLYGMWIACHFMTPHTFGYYQSGDEARWFQMFYFMIALQDIESTRVDALQIPVTSFMCLLCALNFIVRYV